ncbi:hybrid sensor histidine kinase/response regulator [Butyrivibrio sp. WCD3002]|uniref:hybrid sensor histidine kinase/response regulator n=1 Tax=Butyrivibrio sp. WCD3002 TaxID=1280676 RepID=UPI00047D66CB|nr:ATP-binding protein [Butyrivibrio sp. WCD3002]
MRVKPKRRWIVATLFVILFILLAFVVDGIQRRFIYNDRMVQLTTYYDQLDSVITHRFARHQKILSSWMYHLKNKNETGIDSFHDYISSEKLIWEVEEVYLFDEAGNYINDEGESGNAKLDEDVIEKLTHRGIIQVVKYTSEKGKRQDLYILAVEPGEYNGFNYCAIGMGYDPEQMKERLTITAGDLADSENYLTDWQGNLIMASVPSHMEHTNILDYVTENAVIIGSSAQALRQNIYDRKNGVLQVKIAGEDYYLTYLPCEAVDSMLICLTPVSKADSTINRMRILNNIFLLLAFAFVIVLVVGILRYTKMQDVLALAKSTNDTKNKFLANMSHDFRTPMHAMAGYLELMKENADNPEKVIEYGQKAELAHKNMLNMINSVLDLSKMEEGGDEIQNKEFSLEAVLENVKNDTMPLINSKSQIFRIDRSNTKEELFIGDVEKLELILKNLVRNSSTYTEDEGEISLEVYEDKSIGNNEIELRFEVSDNGIGMSKEFIEHIFEPFTREHRQNDNRELGAGLGLAVVKNLVDIMGGTIEAESIINEGTVFTLKLTFEIPEKSEIENMKQISKIVEEGEITYTAEDFGNVFEGMRFLAAEDNELNAEIIMELIKLKGAECDVACDGEKALEAFKNSKPGYYDMILMDIQMPNMDGYEAASAIRNLVIEGREDAATIPILAMSANAFREDIEKTSASGMDAHIPKPIDIKLFENTVKALKLRGHTIE